MDKRSITSAINGKKGGRPKELEDFDGGLSDEVWKPTLHDSRYFVSNFGRVISIKRGSPMLMKQYKNRTGYMRISFNYGIKTKGYFVHVLVLSAFVGEKPEYMETFLRSPIPELLAGLKLVRGLTPIMRPLPKQGTYLDHSRWMLTFPCAR